MSDIPIVKCTCKLASKPGENKSKEKHVLVITNDSTVFLTTRWVSAYEMFGGRVTAVKNLVNNLSEICTVSFGIISGKFGFVPSNYVVMPYDNVPSCAEDYQELQDRTDYVGKIEMISKSYFDKIVVCVPKDMFALLKDRLPDGKVIAVTNPCYEEECKNRGWTYLERRGARVGLDNADKILEIVSNLN